MFDNLVRTLENYPAAAPVSPVTGRKKTRAMKQHDAAVWYSPRDEQAAQHANNVFLEQAAGAVSRNRYVVVVWRVADEKLAIFPSLRECVTSLQMFEEDEIKGKPYNPHLVIHGYQIAIYFPGMSLQRPAALDQGHRPTMWIKAENHVNGKVVLNANLQRLAELTMLPQSNVNVALACQATVRSLIGDWSFCAATLEDLVEHKPDYYPSDFQIKVAETSDYNRTLRTRRFAFSEDDRRPGDAHPSFTYKRVVRDLTGKDISHV